MDPNLQELLNQISSAAGDAPENKGAVAAFTKAISDLMNRGMVVDARRIATEALAEVTTDKSAIIGATSKAVKFVNDAMNSGIKNMFTEIKSTVSQGIAEALGPDKLFGNMDASSFSESGIVKAFEGLRSQLSGLTDDLVINFTAEKALGASLGSDFFKSMEGFDKMATGQYMEYQKLGVDLNRALSTPFKSMVETSGQTATASAETFRKKLMDGTSDLQIHFAVDDEQAKSRLVGISKQFFDLQRQVGESDLNISFKTGAGKDETLGTLASISLLAKSLNKDAADVAGYVNDMTSTWATGGAVAKESLLDIARAAAAGGLPVERTFDLVSGLNGKFSEMGEMSRGLSATFAQFAQNLGPQKLGQAISAVTNLAAGIAGMSDETKAFLALGSDSLGGGGTAIESIIRMEDAIASGDQDKLREIQEEMAAKIEELSGGAMLTREEAVATGQEERFFTQAKLAEQLGASSGRTGYSAFVEGMKGNAQVGVGDLSAMGGEQEIAALEMQRGLQSTSPTELIRRRAEGLRTKFASNTADIAEENLAGPLKKQISSVNLGSLNPEDMKQAMVNMVDMFREGMTVASPEKDLSKTTTAAGMSATTQEKFVTGNADSSSRAQTIETSGAGAMSSRSGITLTENKGELSEYGQTSALAAQSLAASGEGLSAAAAALTNAASQLTQAGSAAATAPVSVHISINGGDIAQVRQGVKQALSEALGNGAPSLGNSSGRFRPNL